VGEGWHARFGGPHAEIMALGAAGDRAVGATVYVSLEPCNHDGKTPPCVDALVRAGVARVVCAVRDPDRRAGGGLERLRQAGIAITVDVEWQAATELDPAFFFAHVADRPWVVLKLATSIDGALTDVDRSSGWLTGPASRARVHHLRAGSDAVGVGVGTLLADDPELTVRDAPPPRTSPARVVFDARLETPPGAAALRGAPALRTIVVATRGSLADHVRRQPLLERAGAEVLVADSMADALRALRSAGIRSMLVEGGAGVAGALLAADVVDRLVIFQAPVILGRGALNAFGASPAVRLQAAARLPVVQREALGDDLMTVYALRQLQKPCSPDSSTTSEPSST